MSDIDEIRNESCDGERMSATESEQDSQSEDSFDEDWIKLSPSKSKGRDEFGKSFRRALKFLNSAYDKLALEQHHLLSAHAESMRQRDLYKDHYPLVEQSLNGIVDFVVSCSEQSWDHAFAVRLKELQSNFVQNKCRLLDQSTKVNEAEDRLYARQYCVTKQQAWFVSCVQKLAYELAQGEGLDDFPVESMSTMDVPFEEHFPTIDLDQNPENENHRSQSAVNLDVTSSGGIHKALPAIETAGLVEWLDSSNGGTEHDQDFDEILRDHDQSLTSRETPDSVWATTVWKILDAQLEQRSGKQAAKDCG